MADTAGGLELETFRTEAKDWLEANFPASLRGRPGVASALMDGLVPQGDLLAWKQAMGAKGWGTPTWPAEYGGGGLAPKGARASAGNGPDRRLQSADLRHGRDHDRPDDPRLRDRGTKASTHPADRSRRCPLVRRLLRTQRRLRSRLAADEVRGRRRSLGDHRPKDLDFRRPVLRLVRRAGPHRPDREEA